MKHPSSQWVGEDKSTQFARSGLPWMKRFLSSVGNGLIMLMIVALFSLGIITIGMQFPQVQTFLVKKASEQVSQKMGYPIAIGKVNIKWFDVVSLEQVSVKDARNEHMIEVDRIDVNIDMLGLARGKYWGIILDEVTLFEPDVNLQKNVITGDLNIDEFISKISELTSTGDTTQRDNNKPFIIRKATVENGVFHFGDKRHVKDTNPNVFDYRNFVLEGIHAKLRDFTVLGDTIMFETAGLAAEDRQTHLKVNRLDTKFLYCQKKVEFANLSASIGQSYIQDYISFHIHKSSDLGYFNDKVDIEAHLEDTRVHSSDLGLFAPYLLTLDETWRISTDFRGFVKDFKTTNTILSFGDKSTLRGNFEFKGLPDVEATAMILDLQSSDIWPEDIVQYYPSGTFHSFVQRFGHINTTAIYAGSFSDFTIKGTFNTDAGYLESNLVFEAKETATTTYRGFLETEQLNLGRVLENDDFTALDFSGHIDGVGLSLHTAATHLAANVDKMGFRGYDYENIAFDGELKRSFFSGKVSAADTNLVFELYGDIDFSQEQNVFSLQGVLEHANLGTLGFTKDALQIETGVNVQMIGNHWDEMNGNALFSDIQLLKPALGRSFVLDSLLFTSTVTEEQHQFNIHSTFLDAEVKGDFFPTRVAADLSDLLKEYQLYFFGNENERASYYEEKEVTIVNDRYKLDYFLRAKEISELMAFLVPDLQISKNSEVSGYLQFDNTAFLLASATIDTLTWRGNKFINTAADLTSSKFINSSEVLAAAHLISERQELTKVTNTERLFIDASWDSDHIDFKSSLHQVGTSNKVTLAGDLRFIPTGFRFRIHDGSQFLVLNEVWQVNPKNELRIEGPQITFENIAISNGRQLVELNGLAGQQTDLKVNVRNLKLSSINPLFNTKFDGIVDGEFGMHDRMLGQEIDVRMDIEALRYDKLEMGNFSARGDWDRLTQRLELNAYLEKNLKRSLVVTGFYNPKLTTNSLDLKGVFRQAELDIIEPFSAGIVSNVSGLASGVVYAKGELNRPLLSGELTVEKGAAKFDYLQSSFTFNDKIYFSESEIVVKNMTLTDTDGNTAQLSGGVYHDGFRYFTLGFDANFNSFKILNTTANDNELFYGVANVTGTASVFGPIRNLTINATVTSNKGTRIFVPFDGATEVTTQDYVLFVSQLVKDQDSTSLAERRRRMSETTGIKMNFNFNITPDAYCEIQMDRQTGDILKAYGHGLLNMKIDTQGDFAMTGSYEMERGDYTFTLQNAINKRFEIKPGSRITWTGNPYEADVNLKASYTQLTSLADVLSTTMSASTLSGNPAYTRRYPVELIITLTERLLSPRVAYNLTFKEYPNTPIFRSNIAAFENKLANDEQELSKQVSSLLLFNTLLSPNNPLFGNQSGIGLGNSVSELISNQISKWASALDQNLEVGLTGLTLDQNMIDNLQLRFSYRFLNDRFRITRDGRLTNVQNQYDAASLLGEWTLEYWFTQNGSIRGRAYNRNIQNPLLLNNTQTTAGFSLQFTRNFNRIFSPINKLDTISIDTIPRNNTSKIQFPRIKVGDFSHRN